MTSLDNVNENNVRFAGTGEEESYVIISIAHVTAVKFLGLYSHYVIKPFHLKGVGGIS